MPKAQILTLDPNTELTFKGPFTSYVTSYLRLTNPTSRPVFFKVKTTAPTYYCVRPNSGLVKPDDFVMINVTLQPVADYNALTKERSRHKFMIQTAYASDEETTVETFWKEVPSENVTDSKLRVVFVTSDEEEEVASEVKENAAPTSASPAASSTASPNVVNDQQKLSSGDAAASAHSQNQDFQREYQKEVELRKMYQDEKAKLEHENYSLLDKLDKMAGNANVEGLPILHVILVAILALLLGIIFGKIVF